MGYRGFPTTRRHAGSSQACRDKIQWFVRPRPGCSACDFKSQRRSTMMDLLFVGIGWTDLAITLNRIAVGVFFMLSGHHKLFNAERHRSVADELKALGVHAVGLRGECKSGSRRICG
jgi:hypothetical protein